MIAIIEPTHAAHDHAAVNSAILHAVALAFPDEELVFAATSEHRAHVQQFDPLPQRIRLLDIDVLQPGGVSACRFWVQWRGMRRVSQLGATRIVLLLSSGPETLFACRLLAAAVPRLRIFTILHGNLNDAVGWRSRDPRRRLFDYRSGLAVARHPRVMLILLEQYIRSAATAKGIICEKQSLVWPHPINIKEITTQERQKTPFGRLHIAFLGSATKCKGFDQFLYLYRSATKESFRFSLIGTLYDRFSDTEIAGLPIPSGPLPRETFMARLKDVDYVCLPFSEKTYALTASGSLLDCVSQLKPLITTVCTAMTQLTETYGPIGFICKNIEEMQRLLTDGSTLADPALYRLFQANLKKIQQDRLPEALSTRVRVDLG